MANLDGISNNVLRMDAHEIARKIEKNEAVSGYLVFCLLLGFIAGLLFWVGLYGWFSMVFGVLVFISFSVYKYVVEDPEYSFIELVKDIENLEVKKSELGRISAGATGEELALEMLSKLPDNYSLYNQVHIPNPSSSTGFNEADLIVVGENGVFIIEVKYSSGEIVVSDKPTWEVAKTVGDGNIFNKELRNPVQQARKLAGLLAGHFKNKGVELWVQNVALFTHPEGKLLQKTSINDPVLTLDEINAFILSNNQKNIVVSVDVVKLLLLNLKNLNSDKV